jgi:regulator of sirC expression with transglutaminase-like and TPR domain
VPQSRPTYCRPEAYDRLQAALPDLETDEGLLSAALAICEHGSGEWSETEVRSQLQDLTARIQARRQTEDSRATVAHAHSVLFDEQGFRGDEQDYYDPRNSLLDQVLQRRRGLPITLTLLYKLVLDPLGVTVRGLNAPGHFMARVEGDAGFTPMIVDPFAGGRVLSIPEAVEQVRKVTGNAVPFDADHLPLASHREWILRMLRNLIGVYGSREEHADRAAMEELARLLTTGDPES